MGIDKILNETRKAAKEYKKRTAAKMQQSAPVVEKPAPKINWHQMNVDRLNRDIAVGKQKTEELNRKYEYTGGETPTTIQDMALKPSTIGKFTAPKTQASPFAPTKENAELLKQLQKSNSEKVEKAKKFFGEKENADWGYYLDRMNNVTRQEVEGLLADSQKRHTELINQRNANATSNTRQRGLTHNEEISSGIKAEEEKIKLYNEWLLEDESKNLKNNADYERRNFYREKNGASEDIKYLYFTANTKAEKQKHDTRAFKGAVSRDEPWYFMNEEERKKYIYLYNTEGKEKAEEYYKYIEPKLISEGADRLIEWSEDIGREHPIAGTAATVALSPYVGAASVGENIKTLAGFEVDDNGYIDVKLKNALRQGVADEHIKSDFGKNVYGLSTSLLDNTVNAFAAKFLLGGWGATPAQSAKYVSRLTMTLMSSEVMANGVIDAKEMGLNDADAITVGIARGVTEYLTGKWSIERILKEPTKILKALKKASASEGTEELFSNWINRVIDTIAYGDRNSITQAYNEQIEKGASEQQAFLSMVWKIICEDTLAFVGGALGGGLMTAGGMGVDITRYGGVKNYNKVLETRARWSQMSDEEVETEIKGMRTAQAAQALAKENTEPSDIALALSVLGVENPEKAAMAIVNFKENGAEMPEEYVSNPEFWDVVSTLKNKGYFRTNSEKSEIKPQSDGTNAAESVTKPPESVTKPPESVIRLEVKADNAHPQYQVDAMVDSLLAEGKRQFDTAYEQETEAGFDGSRAEFLQRYNRYYLKGLNGGKLADADARYADTLSLATRKAAFKAGRADRNAALDAKYVKSNEAVIRDGGVMRNHNTEGLDNETVKAMDKLGKRFGVAVEVADSVTKADGTEVNGEYANGKIRINASRVSGNKLILAVAQHEIAHRVQELMPKQYQKLRDIAYNIVTKDGYSAEVYAKERGLDLDSAIDEVVCDFIARKDFALRVAEEDMSLAQKIKNWLKDILDTVGIKQYTDLERAYRAWEKAVTKAENTVKSEQRKGNTVSNDARIDGDGRVVYSEGEIIGESGINYGIGVHLDSNLLTGLTESERKQMVKEFVVSDLAGKHFIAYDNNNNAVDIRLATKSEMFKNEKGKNRNVLKELYNKYNGQIVKQEAVVLIDELVATARYDKSSSANHKHGWLDDNGKNDWDIWSVFLQEKNKSVWEAKLNVTNTTNGEKILYDISPIKMVEQARKSATSTTKDIITHDNAKSQAKNSEGSLDYLVKENERLTKEAEFYKAQMQRSKEFAPDTKKMAQIARKFSKGYQGNADISAELKEAHRLLNECIKYSKEEKHSQRVLDSLWEKYQDKLREISNDIVNNTVVKNDESTKIFADIKKELRGRRIAFPFESRGDLEPYGGYNYIRKHNFGRFKLGESGTPIDVVYAELNAEFGELFPESITTQTDQLIYINNFFDSMAVVYENPYNSNIAEATDAMANEMHLELMNTNPEMTMADRYFDQAQKMIAKEREKMDEAVRRVRAERDAAIEKIKENARKAQNQRAEIRKEADARKKLLNVARRVKNRAKTADKQNRAVIEELIKDLDVTAVSMTQGTIDNLSNLKEYYDELKKRPNFVPDQRIEADLERLSKKQIADMDMYDVECLTDALLNIENELRIHDKLVGVEDARNIYIQGEEIIRDVENAKGVTKYGVKDKLDSYVTGILNPMSEMHRITGYYDNNPLWKAVQSIQKGEIDEIGYKMRANKHFMEFIEDKRFMKHIRENFKEYKVTEYDRKGAMLGTRILTLNTDMLISLYLHNRNFSNQRHMAYGGVTIPDIILYKKGKIAEAYNEGQKIYLAPSEIRRITSELAGKDLRYARAVYDYFNTISKHEINVVSQLLKGYEIARVNDYFPINTDTNFTKSEFEALVYDGTLENMGFTKERITNATAPIMLRGASDVVEQAIRIHAKYVAYSISVRNFNKLWGVTTSTLDPIKILERDKYGNIKVDENGNEIEITVTQNTYTNSVQKAIAKNWGQKAVDYIEAFISDLQNSRKDKNGGFKFLKWIHSNSIKASMMLNIPVAINQVASYTSAAPEVGYRALSRALLTLGKVDLDLIARYTPLQWNRTQGSFDPTVKEAIEKGWKPPKWLDWMTISDATITRKLWKASEYNIRSTRKDLEVGSHEYYEAVAEVYNRVMMNTQPNSTVMERPGYLRADNFTRMVLPFMGEPLKNANLVYDSVGELNAKKRQYQQAKGTDGEADALKAYKKARSRAITTVTSQIVSTITFSVFVSAARILVGSRAAKKRYEDEEEGRITLKSWAKRTALDSLLNFGTQIPFASEVVDIISAAITGERYWGSDMLTTAAITGAGEAIIKFIASSERMINGEGTWQKYAEDVNKILLEISPLFGIPLKNIENLIASVVGWGFDIAFYDNPTLKSYMKEKYTSAIIKKSISEIGEVNYKPSSQIYDLMYRAFENGDKETYDIILDDMIDSGVETKDIEQAMKTRAGKDESFDFDKSLGRYAGVGKGIDYEEYEKYLDKAEELDINSSKLKEGIEIINSEKPYKEMLNDIKKFTKTMDDGKRDFFIELAKEKYTSNELDKKSYKVYSEKRDEIAQKISAQLKLDAKGKKASDIQSDIYKYADELALTEASNGDYEVSLQWVNEAKNARNNYKVSTGEFIRLYNKYGKTVYNDKTKKAVKSGCRLEKYLEFTKKTKNIKSDVDSNGKTISGSKQDKIIAAIEKMNVSSKEKAYYYNHYYESDKNNPWAHAK